MGESNLGNGLITKIWGPHFWISMHSTAYCYPLNPSDSDKDNYYNYYKVIGDVLPCFYCRQSYKEFIEVGITKLDKTIFESRDNLTKWVYYMHEAVNKKLGVDYGISYEDVSNRYNSYRAECVKKPVSDTSTGCDAKLDKKTISYRIEDTKDCSIIPIKMARQFIKYAQFRKLDTDEFYIINNLGENYSKKSNIWVRRNKECADIIKHMRLQGIKSIEDGGEWNDLPTIEELRLILRLSSNISIEKLTEIILKLPSCGYKKMFYLTK
jgi:hypothetical protein